MNKDDLLKEVANLETQLKQQEAVYNSINGALGFARYLLKLEEDKENKPCDVSSTDTAAKP